MQIVQQRNNVTIQKKAKPDRNHAVYRAKKRNIFGGTASIPVGLSLY